MMKEVKFMEHSTLKVPYEILNKKFRTAQKTIDKEVSQAQSITSEIEKMLTAGATIGDINRLIGSAIERMQILKKKSNEVITDEINAANICKKRLEHLKQRSETEFMSNPKKNSDLTSEEHLAAEDQWKKTRLDRMAVEHLLRQGYYRSADELAVRTNVRHLTNVDIFQTSREVEESLAEHKTDKCIAWCMDNKSKLRKINSNIEFQLRVQEFVELVKQNNRTEAVNYARKYLQHFVKDHLSEITRCMALLAYGADTPLDEYKCYFDSTRWDDLILNFRNENYRLFQLPSQSSLLSVAIQAGLSALKTPQCYSSTSKNINCPVCQNDFNTIAENLPFSHCAQSRLICRVTGEPLNEYNLPMMLPNGQIFGQKAIPLIAKQGRVIECPITKQQFCDAKIEKVFIM